MRIVGGTARGAALAAIGRGDPAAHLRPTADRVRESLFNVLIQGRHGDLVTGARVLDLFAGTGAMAFEALSRDAADAVLVENGRAAQALIRANLAKLRMADRARLLPVDARRLPRAPAPVTLIFLDPPYGAGLGAPALASAASGGWIAPGACVVWEEAAPQLPPEGFAAIDARRYGAAHVTILRAAG